MDSEKRLSVWIIKHGEFAEDGREKCQVKTAENAEWMEGLYWKEDGYDAIYIPVMDETLTFNEEQKHNFRFGVN